MSEINRLIRTRPIYPNMKEMPNGLLFFVTNNVRPLSWYKGGWTCFTAGFTVVISNTGKA